MGQDGVLWRRLSYREDVPRTIKKNRFTRWLGLMMSQHGFQTGLQFLDLGCVVERGGG